MASSRWMWELRKALGEPDARKDYPLREAMEALEVYFPQIKYRSMPRSWNTNRCTISLPDRIQRAMAEALVTMVFVMEIPRNDHCERLYNQGGWFYVFGCTCCGGHSYVQLLEPPEGFRSTSLRAQPRKEDGLMPTGENATIGALYDTPEEVGSDPIKDRGGQLAAWWKKHQE